MELALLHGSVPKQLKGTLFRCGPGRFARGSHTYASSLDGDGRVDRVTFANGSVTALSSFVRTDDYVAEDLAGQPLVRGAFGTASTWPTLRRKNAANTAVVMHAGALLALWEGGLPHELDPGTLQTYGEHSLGGIAQPGAPFTCGNSALDCLGGGGGHGVSAHPKPAGRGGLVTLMSQWTPASTRLTFTEHARGSFRAVRSVRVDHPGTTHVHDFATWGAEPPTPPCGAEPPVGGVIFVAPPIVFDAVQFAMGASIASCIAPGDSASVLYIHTWGRGPASQFPMSDLWVSHFANAFVSDAGKHIIDCISYGDSTPPGPGGCGGRSPPRVSRLIADTRDGTLEEGTLFDEPAEFPTINPLFQGRHHRYIYATTEAGWTRLDTNTLGRATATCHNGGLHLEAVFVPRGSSSNELDGWLLGFCLHGNKNTLCVVCAMTMEVVCMLDASACNRLGLHGHWHGGKAPETPCGGKAPETLCAEMQ